MIDQKGDRILMLVVDYPKEQIFSVRELPNYVTTSYTKLFVSSKIVVIQLHAQSKCFEIRSYFWTRSVALIRIVALESFVNATI